MGFKVVRFSNEEVYYKLDYIIEYLKEQIQ